jgi:hypothetical protein
MQTSQRFQAKSHARRSADYLLFLPDGYKKSGTNSGR